MNQLIGREGEKKTLKALHGSSKAEFLAVYGRRRVGKTFLITEYFRDKGIFFEITGSPNASTSEQLANFHREYSALFESEGISAPPANWSEAFHRLATVCKKLAAAQRIVLFFDELPWLASPRSGFLSALDYFWNRHASRMPNILLIVCGSAASWMIKKVVDSRGGLHGRLSAHMRLLPFTLTETERYLHSQAAKLNRKQICELYMTMGGVPKYLSYISRGTSAAQVIDHLCFSPQGPLVTEFHRLYFSLFDSSEKHIACIQALARATQRGLSRREILDTVPAVSNGGTASAVLRELEEAGFISASLALGKRAQSRRYRLTDEYSLFYLRWIDPVKSQVLQRSDRAYWAKKRGTPAWYAWAGKAFESLCLKHINEIKEALSIGGVLTQHGHWEYRLKRGTGERGAEIDLVIDRADDCIHLCEIKFSDGEFAITKQYADQLERKKEVFREQTKSRKALFTTLITPYGIRDNIHARAVVDHSLTLEDLF